MWEIEYKLERLAARCLLGHPLGLSATDFYGPSIEANGLFGYLLGALGLPQIEGGDDRKRDEFPACTGIHHRGLDDLRSRALNCGLRCLRRG